MGQLIWHRDGFRIYKCHDGHTIHNAAHDWPDAHCHGVKSFDICLQIIDNIRNERMPSSRCEYLFDSHIRLAGPGEYREHLIELKARRQGRKQMYFNPQKGVR